MNLALLLFVIGVLMIVAGISLDLSPTCNQDIKVKIVPQSVYMDIAANQELTDQVYQDMIQN